MDPPANVGLPNSDRSNIGYLAVSSTTRNATSRTPAATKQPSTSPSVKLRSLDLIRANTSADIDAVNVRKPSQSGRRGRGSRDSGTLATVIATAMSPMGRLTKKIHRHDRP